MEWARLEPSPAFFNVRALGQYDKMVDRLLELGITPMLTLHHFSHPAWFHESFPWHKPQSIEIFLRYISKIITKFADRIYLFITFNEPVVWVLAAYGEGVFPPGEVDNNKMMHALLNILKAHKEAYKLIKSANRRAKIGIAKHLISFVPHARFSPFDNMLTLFMDNFFNTMLPVAFQKDVLEIKLPFLLYFKEKIAGLSVTIDFWGINYYYRMFVRMRVNKTKPFELIFKNKRGLGFSDLGWEIYPEGLLENIKKMALYGKDIYVTENGIAATDDKLRVRFLREHLKIIEEGIGYGLPIRGYFHWSLLDNYEWLEGTSARFGLVGINYKRDHIRLEKESLYYYSNFIKQWA